MIYFTIFSIIATIIIMIYIRTFSNKKKDNKNTLLRFKNKFAKKNHINERFAESVSNSLMANPQLQDVLEVDNWARREARSYIDQNERQITMSTFSE